MALPGDISTFTLTFGPYTNAKGDPVLSGATGTLSPSTKLIHAATGQQILASPITVTIDAFGVASVGPLPHTDSDVLNPIGFTYQMVWNLTSYSPATPGNLQFAVPEIAGSTVDFDLLVESPAVPGIYIPVGEINDAFVAALLGDADSGTSAAGRGVYVVPVGSASDPVTSINEPRPLGATQCIWNCANGVTPVNAIWPDLINNLDA